jgi:hypothetical protein
MQANNFLYITSNIFKKTASFKQSANIYKVSRNGMMIKIKFGNPNPIPRLQLPVIPIFLLHLLP